MALSPVAPRPLAPLPPGRSLKSEPFPLPALDSYNVAEPNISRRINPSFSYANSFCGVFDININCNGFLVPVRLQGAAPLEERIIEAARKNLPATVAVGIETDKASFIGSGYVVQFPNEYAPNIPPAPKGFVYVATNHHVIEDAKRIIIDTYDERTLLGTKIVLDVPEIDLAILLVPTDKEMATVDFGNPEELVAGDTLIAIGQPQGMRWTVTKGIVSNPKQNLGDNFRYIQTDAAINGGNSGGPLINSYGKIIGTVTSKVPNADNLGFAIPVDIQMRAANAAFLKQPPKQSSNLVS